MMMKNYFKRSGMINIFSRNSTYFSLSRLEFLIFAQFERMSTIAGSLMYNGMAWRGKTRNVYDMYLEWKMRKKNLSVFDFTQKESKIFSPTQSLLNILVLHITFCDWYMQFGAHQFHIQNSKHIPIVSEKRKHIIFM